MSIDIEVAQEDQRATGERRFDCVERDLKIIEIAVTNKIAMWWESEKKVVIAVGMTNKRGEHRGVAIFTVREDQVEVKIQDSLTVQF